MKYKKEYFFCEKLTDKILPITAKRFYELAQQQFEKKLKEGPIPIAFDLTQKNKKEDGSYEEVSYFSVFSCVSPISEETSQILGTELDLTVRALIIAIRNQMIPIIKEGLENAKKES